MPLFHHLFASAVHAPPDGTATAASKIVTTASAPPVTRIPWLRQAIHAAAKDADVDIWVAALEPYLTASDIATPKRVAALLGQAAVEAGPGLNKLAENTYYHAEKLCETFGHEFPDLSVAQQYAGDPVRIACRAYAGRLGNRDEASGDGWHFRGSGLLQITGRDAYKAFACSELAPVGTLEEIADWIRKPQGAAASACWYWHKNDLNKYADAWELDRLTQAVNGPAMLDKDKRAEAAENALRAVTGA